MQEQCPRCSAERPDRVRLFCGECGALFDRKELAKVHLGHVPGQSLRVERFLQTGDPDYTDARIPIEHTDTRQ